MNPILVEIYSTIIPSAPFLIAAYALILVVILAYVAFLAVKFGKAQSRMAAIERSLERKAAATSDE